MCVKLFKKNLREYLPRKYFSNLDTKCVVDNRKLWKIIASSFPNKSNNLEITTLVKNDQIVSNNIEVANMFNDYFSNLAEHLKLQVPKNLLQHSCQSDGPILKVILKYENHPGIAAIKEIHHLNQFFNNFSLDDIKKELQNLDSSKVIQVSDIPTRIIKENIDILFLFLFVSLNDSICQSNFSHNFKFEEVTPVYKKESRNNRTNYRPVGILPNLSKVFENILYKQVSRFFEIIFSKYQTGLQKGFST